MRDQDDRVHRAWDIFIGLCATGTALMIPVGLVFRLAGETFVTYINGFISFSCWGRPRWCSCGC